MKPYKIKVFRTHVLYITIAIKRNMCAQLLMFTKGCLQQNMALLFKREQNRYCSDNKYVLIKHVSMY